jgi:hypothetical protein
MKKRIRDWLRYGIFTGISWFIGLPACVGDGIGLDKFGEPVDSSGVTDSIPLASTLESIQANVFSAVCAVACHRPPNSYQGLNLEAGKAYENLVDVSSVEIPSMMRIVPGDADNSYIIWKLEDREGILGQRMPLDLPALPSDQIEAIKTWINEGAVP